MANIKCPSCGSPNVEQIDVDKYQCPYCGEIFSSVSVISASKTINIHGYTQWFAVNPDVKVTINGQQVGKVGKGGLLQIPMKVPCQIKFDCNMRSATINVDPNLDTDIYISWDRFSGCLIVNKTTCSVATPPQPQRPQQPVYNDVQDLDFDDEPGCLMNGICFLIPIVGIILYFVKKDTQPNCAHSYLIWALIGFGSGIFINFFL